MPFTLEKLRQRLALVQSATWRMVVPLDGTLYLPDSPSPVSHPAELHAAEWQPLEREQPWGIRWQTVWLKQTLEVPAELREQPLSLHLRWRTDANQWAADTVETQVWLNDRLWCGLDAEHRLAALPPLPEPMTLFLQAHVAQTQPFGGIELVVIDQPAEQLAHTLRVTLDLIAELDADDMARSRLLHRLNTAINMLDLRDAPASLGGSRGTQDKQGQHAPQFYASIRAANAYLDAELYADLQGGTRPQIVVTGHAHIDVAWLWPLWRTRQKAAHTFSTVLRLMEQYPEYHFTASTPQLYAFVQQDFPELYAEIKQRVAEGRWEPIGGMWLEADCNLPSGESLVRQFVFGMRFFAQEFGIRDRVLWLPDVFGYSAALPQILRGCGLDTFMTTKISWSQFNRMPHDTFRWRGIDGSEILTHFVTTPDPNNRFYTYNGHMTPNEVKGAWQEYRQQAINDELLYLMGWGDGGGGPTVEQLETARRLADVPSFPQVRHGSANAYFERLHQRVDADPRLPTWVGELYLEYHRGTYTSQARTKYANRRAEQLYHDAEFLDAWAAASANSESSREQLNAGWQLILLNQFHDILPGSSIPQVYRDAEAQYDDILRLGRDVQRAKLGRLGGYDTPLAIVNTLGWARTDPVVVEEQVVGAAWQVALADKVRHSQLIDDAEPGRRRWLVAGHTVPSYGLIDLSQAPLDPPTPPLTVTPTLLENQFFRIELDGNAEISSLVDKRAQREVIAPGQRGNQLVAFEDRPLNYDAWDIDLFYEEKAYPVQNVKRVEVVETGPIRGGLRIVRTYLNSTITQRVLIYSDLPRIDFETEIDWHEHQTLLKAAFPVDINAALATYEIQFGAVERPTHRNTSWDVARFESCAQRWIDLSEGGYGLTLLNDGKYGHDVHDNVMRLTLLKSAVWPDPEADQGHHSFTYALLPHLGDWRVGEVVRRAAELNTPLIASGNAGHIASDKPLALHGQAFVHCDAAHVVVDTVKTAEDGDGVIVRLYEAHNQRGPVRLTFGLPIVSAGACNLLEEPIGELTVDGQSLVLHVRPFEIKTLHVRFAS